MTPLSEDGPRSVFEQRVAAAATAQTLRYRAAYDELSLIHHGLVAEATLLAATIEERLTPRRTG